MLLSNDLNQPDGALVGIIENKPFAFGRINIFSVVILPNGDKGRFFQCVRRS